MKKSNLSWTLLLVVAVATLSMPLYGLKVAEVIPVPQAEPPVINPAEPEKDAGLEAELPDLFIQKPSFVCQFPCYQHCRNWCHYQMPECYYMSDWECSCIQENCSHCQVCVE